MGRHTRSGQAGTGPNIFQLSRIGRRGPYDTSLNLSVCSDTYVPTYTLVAT